MSGDELELRVLPIAGLPEIEEGTKLGELIAASTELGDGDLLVIAQKIVSKAEGRVRHLSSVLPGSEARRLAAVLGKEPALVELILEESKEVLRAERGVLITETCHGFVCANAGIDSSNLPEDDTVCLLPEDPDASARGIRAEIIDALARASGVGLPGQKRGVGEESGVGPSGQKRGVSGGTHPRLPRTVAVVIADSFGRAWRLGQTEVAIGCAGLQPLDDWRGRKDAHGRELEATLIAIADEAAAAADLVRGKNSRIPVSIVRGLERFVTAEDGPGAVALRRPRGEDLFR
jgi:coenzyme F420-0:L-glutamate ligase/coenzyme F420-1:gamma-L-glutamate ligase